MGMMNNCYFRVLLHPFMDDKGALGVRFQHPAPVEIGERGDVGWREEDNMRMQVCVSMCVCVRAFVCIFGTPLKWELASGATHG